MERRRWVGFVISCLLLLTGCTAQQGATGVTSQALSDGTLVSGRFSTMQGTLRLEEQLVIHRDGRITEIQSAEGTHKFGEVWRDRYNQIDRSSNEYKLSMTEENNRVFIKAEITYPSVEVYNTVQKIAVAQVMNGPLFRTVSVKQEQGPYTAERLISQYGPHEQATEEDWVNFLYNAVQIRFVLHDEATGHKVEWNKLVGELRQSTPMQLTSKQWYTSSFWVGGGVGVFLLFVMYMGLFGRRHWDPNFE